MQRSLACVAELHLETRLHVGRLGAAHVPHGHAGHADQLPAAGAGAGIDGAEVPRQRHGARGHPGARRLAARHVAKARVPARHVDEARREARERGLPGLAGVAGDDLAHVEAEQLGQLGQVFAVVAHGDFDGAARLRAGFMNVRRCAALAQRLDQRGQRDGGGPVVHEQRACRGHQLLHARDGPRQQRAVQRHGGGEAFQLDEQRRVAGGDEAHVHGVSPRRRAAPRPPAPTARARGAPSPPRRGCRRAGRWSRPPCGWSCR